MQQIERTYRGRLNGKLLQRIFRCVATFNSCKIRRRRRQSLMLQNFQFTRTFYGNERVDVIKLVWVEHSYGVPRKHCRCEDHVLLEKRIVESLPKHLRT